MAEEKIVKYPISRVIDLIESWSQYRCGGAAVYRGKSTGGNLFARLLRGMPTGNCPRCRGKGSIPGEQIGFAHARVGCPKCDGSGKASHSGAKDSITETSCQDCQDEDGYSTGEIKGRTCIRCRGSKIIITVRKKVNPATIPATFHGDPMSAQVEVIDRIIKAWRNNPGTLKYYFTIIQEYTKSGTQKQKSARMLICSRQYRRHLAHVHTRIGAALEGI